MSDLKTVLEGAEKLRHREHQLIGVDQLVKLVDLTRTAEYNGQTFRREIPGVFALFDEVGGGKSKQCVDCAQLLFLDGTIDTGVVFTPGSARSTWAERDPLLGEVAKHAWDTVPNVIHEFHKHSTEVQWTPAALNWLVTNYEFIRREERLEQLLRALRGRRVWLILDEAWMVAGWSQQMRATARVRRKRADRVTILNGTPLADGSPEDLYYQFAILDPRIIGCENRMHFRTKYCVMGDYSIVTRGGHRQPTQILRYQNLDDLNARIAPYVLSRRTRDCFDLPPMLPPITVEARLSDETWKIYKAMRDDLVAELGTQVSVSAQTIVKVLRLSQITSGFLGGLEDVDDDGPAVVGAGPFGPTPSWLKGTGHESTMQIHSEATPCASATSTGHQVRGEVAATREIGREKLDATLGWLKSQPKLPAKLLTWCRFRAELARTVREFKTLQSNVLELRGKQRKEERTAAKLALAPGGDPAPAWVVGNQKAGGASLNFAASNIAIYMSNGPRLLERTQSLGRIERPGATQPMVVVDIVAVGPKGQKTIDHAQLKALRAKDDMAQWTTSEWRKLLSEE